MTTIKGTSKDDTLNGTSSNDLIYGYAGNDIINGGAGIDTMYGGIGNDTYYVNTSSDKITEYANEGIDTVISTGSFTLGNNLENLYLTGNITINGTGNNLNNYITGNSNKNVLNGMAGNDTIDGGGGADTMVGGIGNDVYYVDNPGDTIKEYSSDGTDTVYSYISYSLGNYLENMTLLGTGNTNATGNSLNNYLTGNTGNNKINGGAGNDTIDGSAGIDTMIGGAGNDTYYVDEYDDVVTENANQGTDIVYASKNFTLQNNIENLTLIGDAIDGTGNSLNNYLVGNYQDNWLDGKSGIDTMIGGAGSDTYFVDNSKDVAIEEAGEYAGLGDSVESTVSYILGKNIEYLILCGTDNINGYGNDGWNLIQGNSGNNLLSGAGGTDQLIGGGGRDTLVGGTGDDIYYVSTKNTVVIEDGSPDDIDEIVTTCNYTLTDNVENMLLSWNDNINGYGNSLNNHMRGNTGNNILSGGAGDDTLVGGGGVDTLIGGIGNDSYWIDNSNTVIIEDQSAGIYDLLISSVSYNLSNNIENMVLIGDTNINGCGNTLNNGITGNSGNNILSGGDGDDSIDGGTGTDTLIGGKGNDLFTVEDQSDVITERANEGTDTVISYNTYELSDNVENLMLVYYPPTSQSEIQNATGNSLNNTLTGSIVNNFLDGKGGNDTIYGDSGNDTMCGGLGNDYLDGGQDNDIYQFSLGDGSDIITDISGTDSILFKNGVQSNTIAFYSNNNDLTFAYGTDDYITVKDQSGWGTMEKVSQSNNTYLTSSEINSIIQQINAYATSHGIEVTSVNDVKNNQDLMNIIAAGWHS